MSRKPIVATISLRVAGCPPERCAVNSLSLDRAVAEYLEQRHGLQVGERTAEVIRQQLGAAVAPVPALTMEVRGRDTANNAPKNVTLTSTDVCAALTPGVSALLDELAGKAAAARAGGHAEGVVDVLVVFEGGEMLAGLAELVGSKTGLRVTRG